MNFVRRWLFKAYCPLDILIIDGCVGAAAENPIGKFGLVIQHVQNQLIIIPVLYQLVLNVSSISGDGCTAVFPAGDDGGTGVNLPMTVAGSAPIAATRFLMAYNNESNMLLSQQWIEKQLIEKENELSNQIW